VVKRFQSAGLLRNSHSEGFANFRSCWASELEQARRSTKEIAGVAPAYDTWRGASSQAFWSRGPRSPQVLVHIRTRGVGHGNNG
jgi:hypothetical protein